MFFSHRPRVEEGDAEAAVLKQYRGLEDAARNNPANQQTLNDFLDSLTLEEASIIMTYLDIRFVMPPGNPVRAFRDDIATRLQRRYPTLPPSVTASVPPESPPLRTTPSSSRTTSPLPRRRQQQRQEPPAPHPYNDPRTTLFLVTKHDNMLTNLRNFHGNNRPTIRDFQRAVQQRLPRLNTNNRWKLVNPSTGATQLVFPDFLLEDNTAKLIDPEESMGAYKLQFIDITQEDANIRSELERMSDQHLNRQLEYNKRREENEEREQAYRADLGNERDPVRRNELTRTLARLRSSMNENTAMMENATVEYENRREQLIQQLSSP